MCRDRMIQLQLMYEPRAYQQKPEDLTQKDKEGYKKISYEIYENKLMKLLSFLNFCDIGYGRKI